MKTKLDWTEELRGRNLEIVKEYVSGQVTCESIAKKFGVTTRTIQRIAKENNVVRTVGESNKLIAPLKNYSDLKVPKEIKELRERLPQLTRKFMLQKDPFCHICHIMRGHGTRMEITFKDGNYNNNRLDNLVTICRRCLAKKK